MSPADYHDAPPPEDFVVARPKAVSTTREARVSSLRGAEARTLGRRFWLIAGTLVLLVFAAALALSFVSVTNANARINRLKSHGIPVTVTVVNCVGNLSGSGSNVSGYQCRGTYRISGETFTEPIGFKTTYSPSGTAISGLVDPSRHNSVALASAVRKSTASSSGYIPPGVLTVALIALALALRRVARRRPPHEATTHVAPVSATGTREL